MGRGSSEQAIRVTAKGEFGQLHRGLKDLQGDLKNVLGEIDKGARKGGIFDDTQLRALDVYRRRFKDAMEGLNKEFEKQQEIIDRLQERKRRSFAWERNEIEDQIKARQKELDVLRQQQRSIEQMYGKRTTEASSYGAAPGGGSSNSLALAGASRGITKIGGLVGTIGKFALAMAGAGSIISMAQEAYQLARQREVGSLDLAQRMRGYGFSGSSASMYDRVSATGRRDNMGYSQPESWALQEAYTSRAGTLGTDGQYALQKFARGYGLDAIEVGDITGNVKQQGGVAQPKQFADMIASSVSQSGMLPRIMEVMQAHTGLLQNLNTSFKDGSSQQILAYQTTLDRLGNANGMTRLTGQQGANIIGGLGGIFQPGNDKWKWQGIGALQRYNPSKYGGMGLYDLESSFEEGIQNPDNIPAMAKYLREQSGGNTEVFKRLMQSWLQEGGFNATKGQVNELDKITGGFTAFDPGKVASVLGGDSGAKYDSERKDEYGQDILGIESAFQKSLEETGQKFLPYIIDIKSGINGILEDFNHNAGIGETTSDILKFLRDSGIGLIAAMFLAPKVGKTALDVWKGRNRATGLPGEELTEESRPSGRRAANESFGSRVQAEEFGGSRFAQEMNNRYPRQPGETFSDWTDRVRWQEGRAQGTTIDPEGWMERFDADPPPEGAAKNGGFFKSLKGLGNGAANLLGYIPAMLAGVEAERENPNDTFLQKLNKALLKILPSNISGKDQLGDSDIGETIDNVQDTSRSLIDFSKDSTKTLVDLGSGGSEALLNLEDKGLISIKAIQKDGTALITTLSEKGTIALNDLNSKGILHYSSVEKITATKFDEIIGIHQSFFSSLARGSSGSASAASDVTRMSGVTADQLNSQLKGKLSGHGQDFVTAGQSYGIDPAFLAAVAMHETGNGSVVKNNNIAGMMGAHGLMAFGSVQEGIDAEARNLKNLYINQGLTTVADIQKRYAPVGASNDPNNLNSNWTKGVLGFYNGFGSLGGSGTSVKALEGGGGFLSQLMGGVGNLFGGDFFSGWRGRVTSGFGADRGNRTHGGLDIDGEQGDALSALANGKISFIKMDDGGAYDDDGKANSRMGGTELGVTMENGMTYFYSHLSKINPAILKAWESGTKDISVGQGDYLGNLGGDVGKPGSGYSTTGSHLHLGYMDKSGNLINPTELLNGLGVGDSSIGKLASEVPGSVKELKISVDVNLKGEGVSQLNNMTIASLKALIGQTVNELRLQNLAMNPTARG